MKYEIFKAPLSCKYKYRELDKDAFSILDYVTVYDSTILVKDYSIEDTLEVIFEMLNISWPDDYHASSLSVSDLICFVNGKERTWYYVNPVGFVDVTDLVNNKVRKTNE